MHVRTPGLLVVHLMMVRWSAANSSSGPFLIWTRSAFLTGGSTCAVVDVLVRGGRETERSVSRPPSSVSPLRNGRTRERRDAADRRCAGRKRRRGDEELIPLGRRRTTEHACTRKRVPVGKRCCEPVREGLQEGHDLVLLQIRQGEIPGRHVEIVPDLGHRPAVHFFDCAWRAVP